MDLFKQMLVLGSIGVASLSFGQISSGKVEEVKPEEPAPRVKRIPTEGMDEFAFYLGAGRVYANRKLTPNVSPYGAQLGIRAAEDGFKTWSYQIGVRNRVSKWLSYDAGLAIDRAGESFSFAATDTDSTYSYTSRYTYYALPMQVFLTYGKDFRFFVGGGIQPELFAGFKQEQKWTTATNTQRSQDVESEKGFNPFGLGVLASAGVQWRLGNTTSLYCVPTMMWNLVNTYDQQADYIHKARTFNLKFGLVFHIPQ